MEPKRDWQADFSIKCLMFSLFIFGLPQDRLETYHKWVCERHLMLWKIQNQADSGQLFRPHLHDEQTWSLWTDYELWRRGSMTICQSIALFCD